jgi:glycosyltransferase involved in cell wall biosynthesis
VPHKKYDLTKNTSLNKVLELFFNMKSISIIIPALNEEDNILPVYKEVSQVLKKMKLNYEIIFINDGSNDSTLEKMLSLNKKDSKVRVIDFRKNFGQSAAMQAGFDHATKELVCYIDSDLQIDFSELELFLKEIDKKSDCVVGWRHKRKDSFCKTISSKLARCLRKRFLGTDLHDYGCPFKVFTKECLAELDLYGEMHRYIPPMLRWKGFKTSEVKISHRPRKYGCTKYNIWRIPKGFLDMIVVWFWQKYAFRPLHIFGFLGITSIAISMIFGLTLIWLRFLGRISLVNSSLPLFTAFLFLTGITFFCFGIISDILVRTYYKAGQIKNYTIRKKY